MFIDSELDTWNMCPIALKEALKQFKHRSVKAIMPVHYSGGVGDLDEIYRFAQAYNLRVIEIPTNRSVSRLDDDDEIYKTEKAKLEAIVKSIKEAHNKKQPVLVGTVSIEKSEELSRLLKTHKLPHSVLNAKYHAQEAEIIAQAGVAGAITIATNMAGRGTDIVLGGKDAAEQDKKTVIDAGGLYVLGSERHESRRIDNQLRGRSGRQGDPGTSKFFLSLQDDLMRIFGSEKLQSVLSTLGLKDEDAIFHPWITRTLAKAQQKVENRNYEIRKNLLRYDDIVNQQRKNIFGLRSEVMGLSDISDKIIKMSVEINEDIVARHVPKNSYFEQWDIDTIELEIKRIYGLSLNLKNEVQKENITEIEILDFINQNSNNLFASKKSLYGAEIFQQIERQIFLLTLDSEWKDHLLSLDKLRHGINLRAYAQKDPLIEYKKDAFNLFEDMMLRMEEQIVSRVARAQFAPEDEEGGGVNLIATKPQQKMFETRSDPAFALQNEGVVLNSRVPIRAAVKAEERDARDPNSWGNVGRNESCPCGGGKKFKHCHGMA